MIGSPEPARWDLPPTRLCFLESLEVAPSAAGAAGAEIGRADGIWSPGAAQLPSLDAADERRPRAARVAKRALDIAGALVGLVVSAPLVALCAVAISCCERGPAFFRQPRCGRGGRIFSMWKLRTMVPDAEERLDELRDPSSMDGPVFKPEHDPRITPLGRVLRRFSLDELPQFWNVLCGDMSLVGPRPPLPSEVALYGPRELRRLSVRPGLTCSWQVSGRNDIPFEQWLELDLDYIEHWSLGRDLALIARTLPAMITGKGAR